MMLFHLIKYYTSRSLYYFFQRLKTTHLTLTGIYVKSLPLFGGVIILVTHLVACDKKSINHFVMTRDKPKVEEKQLQPGVHLLPAGETAEVQQITRNPFKAQKEAQHLEPPKSEVYALNTLKYVGYMRVHHVLWALIEKPNKQVIWAKKGDMIEAKAEVISISHKKMAIKTHQTFSDRPIILMYGLPEG